MNFEEAKSTFLLEHCAERCEGYQNDDTCKNCEINVAIKAIDKQIPKKPEPKKDASGEYYVCLICGVYQEYLTDENWCETLLKTWLYNTKEEAIEVWNRRAE